MSVKSLRSGASERTVLKLDLHELDQRLWPRLRCSARLLSSAGWRSPASIPTSSHSWDWSSITWAAILSAPPMPPTRNACSSMRAGHHLLRLFRSRGRPGRPRHQTASPASELSSTRSSTATRRQPVPRPARASIARGGRFFYVVLTAFVMISAIMVSYTRARAESLIGSASVRRLHGRRAWIGNSLGALFNRNGPARSFG